ncbi:MAG: hypothetical protein KAY32_10155 [Candidatus Eisenbacteria sp.]|nr:hypothetical protein [Candidatus Eisenbacteria bacterium]
MSTERRQVLDLLAEGKVTAEEAERLLERLAQVGGGESSGVAGGVAGGIGDGVGGGVGGAVGSGAGDRAHGDDAVAVAGKSTGGKSPKFLRVVVNSVDGDQVNVRVPIALVRTGIQLGAMLPSEAHEKLREKGIDLSNLSGLDSEEMIEALRELTIDVDSAKGDVVRVFCE